jgi:hypothetical protein
MPEDGLAYTQNLLQQIKSRRHRTIKGKDVDVAFATEGTAVY